MVNRRVDHVLPRSKPSLISGFGNGHNADLIVNVTSSLSNKFEAMNGGGDSAAPLQAARRPCRLGGILPSQYVIVPRG